MSHGKKEGCVHKNMNDNRVESDILPPILDACCVQKVSGLTRITQMFFLLIVGLCLIK